MSEEPLVACLMNVRWPTSQLLPYERHTFAFARTAVYVSLQLNRLISLSVGRVLGVLAKRTEHVGELCRGADLTLNCERGFSVAAKRTLKK